MLYRTEERPEFNKPIRAVLASLTYEDWNAAYMMQKFSDGELVNSRQQGFAGYFPKYRSLRSQQMQALQDDSLIYMTEESPDYTYRTLLWKEAPNSTIKVSTTLPDYRLILFFLFPTQLYPFTDRRACNLSLATSKLGTV
ncbi:MAG: hypothetical protein U5J63_15190 [Fodinibius sp.]|nr:hypothetical protein [Fodinibius sp.]